MKAFDWDNEKNKILIAERGISFEEIIFSIGKPGGLLDVIDHHNAAKYRGQQVFIVAVRGYVYAVPFIEDETKIFLKTIYPSRKLTKQYLGKDENDA
jgi:uncharacterized DUF497 family protein